MRIPKLLIPLDGSEFSRKILPYVRNICTPFAYEIDLLRVTKAPEVPTYLLKQTGMVEGEYFDAPSEPSSSQQGHPGYATHVEDNLKARLEDEMLKDARYLKEAGFSVTRAVRFGNPAKEILNYVEHHGVELVAMATHGRTGLGRLLMGSVAETVLRRLSVPVLLIQPIEVANRESHSIT